ncbi:hypothetical protein [Ornithinimicrobium panacihumi]|uniref:hypothetical protein n=1 Tax=Ornithinimicrobium panacihumi TaxID=2008449 RepID=UPI003F8CE2E1
MNASVVRALEDLLRRVLRSPDHGIDPAAVGAAAQERAVRRGSRRELLLAGLVAAATLLVLLGWFLAEWSRTT